MKPLVLELCALQEAVQRATVAAKHAGNEAVYHELRQLAWSTAALLADIGREQECHL